MEDKYPNTSFSIFCVSMMTSPCSLNRSMSFLQNLCARYGDHGSNKVETATFEIQT